MSDEILSIGLDPAPLQDAVQKVISALETVKRALSEFANTPADKMKAELEKVTSAAKTASASIAAATKGLESGMARDASKGAQAMAKALKDEGDKAVSIVKAQRQQIQAEYEAMVSKGWKIKGQVLLEYSQKGVQLTPDDRIGLLTYKGKLKDSRITVDDTRALFGIPGRDEMKSFAAQLKAQMQEDLQGANLRARSASRMTLDDTRSLLGMPGRDEMKSFAAQLKAQMQEGLQGANLRARAATPMSVDETLLLLGMNPSNLVKSAKASAEVFKEAFAAAARANGGYAKDAAFLSMSPASQLTRATRVNTAMSLGMGEVDAVARYGQEAVTASKNLALLQAAAQNAAREAEALRNASRGARGSLNDTGSSAAGAARTLKDMSVSMNDLHSAARGVASGFNAMWLTWGNIAPLLAGAALSNAFVQSIKKGAEFTNTLRAIEVLGGESSDAMEKLSAKALELGSKGPYGPLEVAGALKTLSLAGLDAKKQLDAITAVKAFATVGEMDINTSAQGLVSIATAYGYAARDFSVVGDVVAKTAASSMASVEGMTEAFKQASVVAQQYGVTLNDTSTTLALLSQIGIRGSAAGTAMRNMYTELMGSSQKAKKVLKDFLGVDVWDNAAKAMKPLPQIMRELSDSLGQFDSKSQQNLLQSLGNERGMKALVANLVAYQTKLREVGGSTATEFDRIAKEIEDAPGYAAVAAAEMAQSTANQLKSVGATLEVSLVGAFSRTEPAVQSLALQLRSLFGSDGFKQAVSGLASTVADLTSFLLRHADVITSVAEAYLILKGVSLGLSAATALVSSSMAAAGQFALAARNGYAAVSSTVAAYTAVQTGAASGAMVLGSATAAAGVSAAAASGGFRLLMASLGPLSILLTIGAAAWAMWGNSKSEAQRKAEASRTDIESTMEAIRAEKARLEEVMKARAAGVSAEMAETKAKAEMVKAKIDLGRQEGEQELKTAREVILANREKVKAYVAAGGGVASSAQQNALNTFDSQLLDNSTKMLSYVSQTVAMKREVDDFFALAVKNAAEADKVAADRRKGLVDGSKKFDMDMLKGDKGLQVLRDNEIKELEKQYALRTSLIESYVSTEKSILDNARSSEAISQGAYVAREVTLIEQSEQQKLAVIQEFGAKWTAEYQQRYGELQALLAIAKAKGDTKGVERLTQELDNAKNSAATFAERLSGDAQKIENSSLVRIKKQADEAAGAVRKLKKGYEDYQLAESRQKADRDTRTALNLQIAADPAMTDTRATVLRAEFDEQQRINTKIREYDDAIRLLNKDIDDYLEGTEDILGVTQEQLNAYTAMSDKLKELQRQRSEVQKGAAESVKGAGGDAAINKFMEMTQLDLGSVFDGGAKAAANFIGVLNKLVDTQEAYNKAKEAAKGDTKKLGDIERLNARAQIRNYGDMAAAAKGFFKEKTGAYKVLQAAEQAFRAWELAEAISATAIKLGLIETEVGAKVAGDAAKGSSETAYSVVAIAQSLARTAVKAQEALASALGLPPPFGWVAFGVTAAMLASIGIKGFSGGGGGSATPLNEGKGTVLGDKDEASESLSKSLEYLKSLETISKQGLYYSSLMVQSLQNLEVQMGGVSSLVVRNGSTTATANTINVGFKQNAIGNALSAISSIPIIGTFLSPLGNLLGGLFGTKTKVTGSGFIADAQNLGSILDGGLDLYSYADINKKKKALGITYSSSNSTRRAAADPETARQFTLILTGIANTVAAAAGPLGIGADKIRQTLNGLTVNLGKINLQGLTGEQIQEKLANVFSAAGDKIAQQAIPGLEDFQRVGEGYLETLVRVASTLELVNSTFDTLGNTLYTASLDGARLAVELVDAFGGTDAFYSATSAYYEAFYSEAERLKIGIRQMKTVFGDLGVAVPATKDEFRALVDAAQAAGDQDLYVNLVKISPVFAELADAAKGMTDDLLSYINDLKGNRAGLATPVQQLAAARQTYTADLIAARGGDQDAISRITSSAQDYIDAQKVVTASSATTQAVIDQVITDLTGVTSSMPHFAAGGYHEGGWAMVGEEGPELAYFGSQARIYNAQQSSAMLSNDAVVSELRALREEVVQLRAQQNEETRAVINSNAAIQGKAAEAIVSGVTAAGDRQAWTQSTQPVIN